MEFELVGMNRDQMITASSSHDKQTESKKSQKFIKNSQTLYIHITETDYQKQHKDANFGRKREREREREKLRVSV